MVKMTAVVTAPPVAQNVILVEETPSLVRPIIRINRPASTKALVWFLLIFFW